MNVNIDESIPSFQSLNGCSNVLSTHRAGSRGGASEPESSQPSEGAGSWTPDK